MIANKRPDPRLLLKYFEQRDVYSDDPFTPEVEPSQTSALHIDDCSPKQEITCIRRASGIFDRAGIVFGRIAVQRDHIGTDITAFMGCRKNDHLPLVWQYPLLVALGHTAVLLNLFNLVPVPPLDGGRIAGAFTRGYWVAGYAIGAVALVLTRSPLLLIVLILGLVTLVRRWRDPVPGYDALPARQRVTIGLVYAALVAALLVTLPLHD